MNFKHPLFYIISSALLGAITSYFLFYSHSGNALLNTNTTFAATNTNVTLPCKHYESRLNGFNHIKPVLLSEQDCESEQLDPIKNEIKAFIETEQNSGRLTSASVYLKLFSKDEWTSYNGDELYHPASLNKVAVLISYLHAAESYNSLLDEKLLFEKHDNTLPIQYYTSKTLKPGTSYAIRDLLHYMIAYSDNDATQLLLKHIDFNFYTKTFTDIGLPKPGLNFDESMVSVKQYSLFMKVLYNASYISIPASEFATDMLAECDFKEGLVKKLPSNVQIAHKFGECRYDDVYELHESGIIYIGDNAYLITIMTKGPDRKNLSEVIGNISNLVYTKLTAPDSGYF
jgi:beta-lactamase class A